MSVVSAPAAAWPLRLAQDLPEAEVAAIRSRVDELADAAQYGWGHTVDFGPFSKRGLMGKGYLRIAGALDSWGWWPEDLAGKRVADVGCFTGGLSMYLAARGPEKLYAVDELGDHLDQCAYMAGVFGFDNVETIETSLYRLGEHVEPGSLDLILLSGVLYHLSDMLVGLQAMRELLAPGGVLIIETNAVDDAEHSYANFGRFYKGMWWQPTGLCVRDMCEFMGYDDVLVRFYVQGRCLVRAVRGEGDIPFKRGMNWTFDSLRDARPRTTDETVMAPVPHPIPGQGDGVGTAPGSGSVAQGPGADGARAGAGYDASRGGGASTRPGTPSRNSSARDIRRAADYVGKRGRVWARAGADAVMPVGTARRQKAKQARDRLTGLASRARDAAARRRP